MSKAVNSQVWLAITGILIWIAVVIFFFTPFQTTFQTTPPPPDEKPGDVLPEVVRFILVFFVASLVALLTQMAFAKRVCAPFVHFQAMAALVPLTYLATGIAFLSYAMLRLGYFPQPNRPDPATIGLGIGQLAVVWFAMLAGALLFYFLSYRAGLVTWLTSASRFMGLLSCAIVWFAFWLMAKYDAFYFIQWICD